MKYVNISASARPYLRKRNAQIRAISHRMRLPASTAVAALLFSSAIFAAPAPVPRANRNLISALDLDNRSPAPSTSAANTFPGAEPEDSASLLPINQRTKPTSLSATFWEATDSATDLYFEIDGPWESISDSRAFSTISMQQQVLGYECEWMTVGGAVWTLKTGQWSRFGPPSQLQMARCKTSPA